MKTNFKEFLLESQRTLPLSIEDAVDYVAENCMEAFNSEPVYRGDKSAAVNKFMHKDPTISARRSIDLEENFYTLIISNSDRWSEYPRRDRSLICSTNIDSTDQYGLPCYVFAHDNAKWGVCPSYDMWMSFKKTLYTEFNIADLEVFSRTLKDYLVTMEKIGVLDFPDHNFSTDYETMLSKFEMIDGAIKELGISKVEDSILDYIDGKQRLNLYVQLTNAFAEAGSMIEALENILDPVKNDFILTTESDSIRRFGHGNEIWTSSPCILVAATEYTTFSEMVRNITDGK